MALSTAHVDRGIRILGGMVGAGFIAFGSMIISGAVPAMAIWWTWFLILPSVGIAVIGILIVREMLLRPLTVRSIRFTVGFLAWVLFGALHAGVDRLTRDWVPLTDDPHFGVISLVSVFGAVMFFEVAGRWLVMRSSAAPAEPPRVSKASVGLVCFLLWLATCQILTPEALRLPGSQALDVGPGLVPIVTAIIAFIVYTLVIHDLHQLPGWPVIGPIWHAYRQRALRERRSFRAARGRCGDCNYDVRRTIRDGRRRCPECGFWLDPADYPVRQAEA